MSSPRQGDWSRNSEPGAAFSGLSRGRRGNARGGAGSGSSRGGRGSRGRGGGPNRAASASTDKATKNDAPAEAPKTVDLPKPPPSTITSKPDKPATTQKSRPSNSRKTSSARPIPTIVTPSTSTDTVTSTSTAKNSSRPPNRRKRSQTNTKTGDNIPKIEILSLDDTHLRSQRGRGGKAHLPIPPHSAPLAKDTPPHLTPNNPFDMRNNIDALVERVRAVAMDRPTTPGSHSHIDWAGDDDDSLPDLDDWGVNPSSDNTTSFHNSDMISPIMIDGLKSLPDPSPLSMTASISPSSSTKEVTESTEVKVGEMASKKDKTDTPPKINHRDPLKTTLPLHPSLPPKPSFVEARLTSHRVGATPMRSPLHSKFQPSGRILKVEEKVKTVEKVPKASEPPPIKDGDTTAPTPAPVKNDPFEDNKTTSGDFSQQPASTPNQGDSEELIGERPGLQVSVHAPRNPADDADEARPGLQASMHAPKARSESSITPPTMVQAIIADGNRGNIISPNRFHLAAHPHAFSHQGSSRFSRSGNSTPHNRALDSAHHARTHSTPPAGTSPHAYRAPHATRPVITGAAISRLARDIGVVSMSPTRNPVALSSKE
ncbi:hypothetical protein E1B28_004055 [Marasmius oreades]|uniref:Uncharacterized protein n=1 Tax=Marasmius oreades TaxID=181124 RepID=A0A9P7UXU1_9AGAR|nr:uncharacterized protein E1B28_004055 [Marasmius oreades]KAG7096638.1 hypothetical protein E1B28_004055 [Marasmius oreades]